MQQLPVARRFAKAHRQTRSHPRRGAADCAMASFSFALLPSIADGRKGKERAKSGVALLRDVCEKQRGMDGTVCA